MFTVKNSGVITEAQVRVSRVKYGPEDISPTAPISDLDVSIVSVDRNGQPSDVLSSTVVPAGDIPLESSRDHPVGPPVVVRFQEQPRVVSGGRYALRLDTTTCCYTWWSDTTRYKGGPLYWMREGTSGRWRRSTLGDNFAIYVDAEG